MSQSCFLKGKKHKIPVKKKINKNQVAPSKTVNLTDSDIPVIYECE